MVQPANRRLVTEDRHTALTTRVSNLERDTGWRAITGEPGTSGRILLRRVGRRVTLRLDRFLPPAGNYAIHVASIPSGFRFSGPHYFIAWGSLTSVYGLYSGAWLSWVRSLEGTVHLRPTTAQDGTYSFETDDPWPATLPGTPA